MSAKKLVPLTLVVFFLVLTSLPALAQPRPFQLSLVTPVQIYPEEDPISGIRLNLLYGRNVSVSGVDFGLVNHTTSGIFNGAQFGLVGLADSDFTGWQHNWGVNITNGDFKGYQLGAVNYANFASGLQLGLVNYANTMKGLQIGLVNIIHQGGQFPVFPIVNWSF